MVNRFVLLANLFLMSHSLILSANFPDFMAEQLSSEQKESLTQAESKGDPILYAQVLKKIFTTNSNACIHALDNDGKCTTQRILWHENPKMIDVARSFGARVPYIRKTNWDLAEDEDVFSEQIKCYFERIDWAIKDGHIALVKSLLALDVDNIANWLYLDDVHKVTYQSYFTRSARSALLDCKERLRENEAMKFSGYEQMHSALLAKYLTSKKIVSLVNPNPIVSGWRWVANRSNALAALSVVRGIK